MTNMPLPVRIGWQSHVVVLCATVGNACGARQARSASPCSLSTRGARGWAGQPHRQFRHDRLHPGHLLAIVRAHGLGSVQGLQIGACLRVVKGGIVMVDKSLANIWVREHRRQMSVMAGARCGDRTAVRQRTLEIGIRRRHSGQGGGGGEGGWAAKELFAGGVVACVENALL